MGFPEASLERVALGVALPPAPTVGSVQDKLKTELGFRNAWPGREAERPTWAGPRGCEEPAGLTAGLGFSGARRRGGKS